MSFVQVFVSMERETIGNPEDDETTSPALVHLLPIDDNIRLHLNDDLRLNLDLPLDDDEDDFCLQRPGGRRHSQDTAEPRDLEGQIWEPEELEEQHDDRDWHYVHPRQLEDPRADSRREHDLGGQLAALDGYFDDPDVMDEEGRGARGGDRLPPLRPPQRGETVRSYKFM